MIPCLNGGRCKGVNLCRCPPGYNGDHCEVGHSNRTLSQRHTCSLPCRHGECVAPNKCECHEGWYGRRCQRGNLFFILSCLILTHETRMIRNNNPTKPVNFQCLFFCPTFSNIRALTKGGNGPGNQGTFYPDKSNNPDVLHISYCPSVPVLSISVACIIPVLKFTLTRDSCF